LVVAHGSPPSTHSLLFTPLVFKLLARVGANERYVPGKGGALSTGSSR
jgi:hypothetical protein